MTNYSSRTQESALTRRRQNSKHKMVSAQTRFIIPNPSITDGRMVTRVLCSVRFPEDATCGSAIKTWMLVAPGKLTPARSAKAFIILAGIRYCDIGI